MIVIRNKKECCGCNACRSICPKACISMKSDEEGFLYPIVDSELCINCGLCEKVCPVLNQDSPRKPFKVYAAKNNSDEVRLESSSGGIFSVIAEGIIEKGGVVFGAKFDKDWNVVHAWTDTKNGLAQFRGSKYVQSIIGETYKEAETFLQQGRTVLYSGTPCQIAGLRKYLRRDFDNLFTIDVVCHGVPSPLVWREYIKSLFGENGTIGKNLVLATQNPICTITGISFRDKSKGWKNYCFKIGYTTSLISESTPSASEINYYIEPVSLNMFMDGFLKNIYLRPSCYDCASKSGKSGSDVTIADFWGVNNVLPELDDDKGVSAVLLNTDRISLGKQVQLTTIRYEDVYASNSMIEQSVAEPKERELFWREYPKQGIGIISKICKKMAPSLLKRVFMAVKRRIGL